MKVRVSDDGAVESRQRQLTPMVEFEHVDCLLCGRDDTTVFVKGNGPAQLVKCQHDSLVYLNPRPKSSTVRDFHKHYVREDNLEMFASSRMAVLRKEAEEIKSVKTAGKLLDVGCATGTFFQFFKGPGWELYGIETTPMAAEAARSQYRVNTFTGTLGEACYPSEFFDIVSVLDVIYYFSDPKRELFEVRRILKSDGLLAIEIPGSLYRLIRGRGPLCWLLDRKWSRLSPDSYYLYYFNSRTIRQLLKSAGFRIIAVYPEQANLGRQGIAKFANSLHFLLARVLFHVTFRRVSIAGKELYLAVKDEP